MKILVINPFGIGDVLFSTPLIRALKRHYPQSSIAYFCNKRTEPILSNNPNIDKVFVFERDEYRSLWRESRVRCIKKVISLLRDIKKEKFDIAIDLSVRKEYAFYLWILGVSRRIGFDYRRRGRYLTEKIKIEGYDDKHVIEYCLDVLRYMGIESDDGHPEVFIAERDKIWATEFLSKAGVKDDESLIGVMPGGGASWGHDVSFRRWYSDRFAEAADRLTAPKVKIILFGDKSELKLCNSVVSVMKNKPVIACGLTTLPQLAALFNKCALVIANDSGSLHLAVASGAKTVSIYGPVDDKVYGPYPPGPKHIPINSGLECWPCYKRFTMSNCSTRDCLDKITVNDVVTAAERLL